MMDYGNGTTVDRFEKDSPKFRHLGLNGGEMAGNEANVSVSQLNSEID